MSLYMAIDIGTSSVKTLVFSETGTTVALAQKECVTRKIAPTYSEQDFNDVWKLVKDTIRKVIAEIGPSKSEIKAVSYSGQMHGLVLLDKQHNLLRDVIIWSDQRSTKQVEDIYHTISKKQFQKITLNSLSTGYTATSLKWVKDNEPKIYEQIYKVMLPKDYIRYCMTQEVATDISDASATLLYNTNDNQWSWDIIDQLGFDRSFFPECYEAHKVVGSITALCAHETGLPQGTKVVCGGGDSLMQQVGNGVLNDSGIWIANIGTSCSCNCGANTAVHDEQRRINVFSHVRGNNWMLMGANTSGGVALRWLRDNILKGSTYQEMTELAAQVEAGSEGLIFTPYLSGARCPVVDPKARGSFIGLTMKHDKGHLIRSVMEGVVYSIYEAATVFKEMSIESKEVIASGGGAKGSVFCQVEADVFNLPVKKNMCEEQSCLGAAITAAIGAGEYVSYEQGMEAMVHFSQDKVFPVAENNGKYKNIFAIYQSIYKHNKKIYQMLDRSI